jgi:hypothetical protein
MNQKLILAATGLLLMGITGIVMVTAEPGQGPALIAGDQPVTEDQVRQKLQSDGWSNVQIVREGRYIEAIGAKNGQTSKVVVNAENGRLRAGDDDDDD